jgi:hypothetical protein
VDFHLPIDESKTVLPLAHSDIVRNTTLLSTVQFLNFGEKTSVEKLLPIRRYVKSKRLHLAAYSRGYSVSLNEVK